MNKWATSKGIQEPKSLLNNEGFKKEIIEQMNRLAAENHFTGLEKVKRIHLFDGLFTVENNLLTPTFKLKRNEAKIHFQKQITEMYALGENF